MPTTALIGLQWGDEGKGKMVDLLAADARWVVRCQGGSNAGHTVKVGDQTTVLHLIPSGILTDSVNCVIGHGVVLDPGQLLIEMDRLQAAGIRLEGRLFIADRAQVVFPHHKTLDALQEASRGAGKLGTTGRGIGPAYGDKALRRGLRMQDLLDRETLAAKLETVVAELTRLHGAAGFEAAAQVVQNYSAFGERLRPHVVDTVQLLLDARRRGESIFLEGAQGALLDIDLGTYPFVTSSNTQIGGLLAGCGLPARAVDRMIGVLKAYSTRVGSGPFVTELFDAHGERLRERGREFGSTTGRPRRCGWFDAVAARFAIEVNGVDSIALTKIDVLSGFDEIAICEAYRIDGRTTDRFPSRTEDLARAEPVYRRYPGWGEEIGSLTRYDDLPRTLREFVDAIEAASGASVDLVSTGPRRSDILERRARGRN